MKVFEISNFSKGYDDSISAEYAPPESSQDSLYADYTRVPGALSRAYGESADIGTNTTHPISGDDIPPSNYPPSTYRHLGWTDSFVQIIYEGKIFINSSGNWVNKRFIVSGGLMSQYCPGDILIPIGGSVGPFRNYSMSEYLDATHYINNFYIMGGHNNYARVWNGLDNNLQSTLGYTVADVGAGHNIYYRAKYTTVFEGRLFIANTNESTDQGATWTKYPNRVRWAAINDPTVWDIEDYASTDASYNDVYDKDGDEIVRLFTLGDNLLVFKRNSIHRVVSTGGEGLWEFVQIDPNSVENVGFSIAPVPGGLMFLNKEGFQITDGNETKPHEPSAKVKGILDRCYIDTFKYAYAVSNESTQEYHIILPVDGGFIFPGINIARQCNFLITWNWRYDTWSVKNTGSVKAMSALGIFTDDIHSTNEDNESTTGTRRLIIGYHLGGLTTENKGFNSSYGRAGNTLSYQRTPWLDFGKPGEYKEVLAIQLKWSGAAGSTLEVYYIKDNDTSYSQLTTDSFDVDDVIEQPYLSMRATGRKFRFLFYSGGGDYTVYSMKIFYNERSLR